MYFLISIFIFSPFALALLLLIMIEFQKKNKGEDLEIVAGLLLVLTLITGFYFHTVYDLNDWFKEENGKQAKEISTLTGQNKELKTLNWKVEEENKKLEGVQGKLAEKSESLELYRQKYETLQEKEQKLENREKEREEWQYKLKRFEDNISELATSLNQTTKTQ